MRQLVVWPEQARNSWKQKRQSIGHSQSPHGSSVTDIEEELKRPFLSYTRTEDGASIVTETRILRWMFGRRPERSLSRNKEGLEGYESVVEEIEFQLGGQLAVGYVTDTTDLEASSDEEEDVTPMTRSGWTEETLTRGRNSQLSFGIHTPPLDEDRPRQVSLPTTPRDSPGLTSIPISWTKSTNRKYTIPHRDPKGYDGERNDSKPKTGRKRCLQLDLRGFGNANEKDTMTDHGGKAETQVYHMDKSGLVTLFSDLLDKYSIRMLYSSTFNTANILVEAVDVYRARRVLQGKEKSPTG